MKVCKVRLRKGNIWVCPHCRTILCTKYPDKVGGRRPERCWNCKTKLEW